MHTDDFTKWSDGSMYGTMINSLLVDEKVSRHKALFAIQPLKTVSFIENEIKKPLRAIFDPKYFSRQISASNDTREKIEAENSRLQSFVRKEVFDSYFSRWNSFIVADVVTETGELKPYLVSIDSVIDYDFVDNGDTLDWIIYRRNGEYFFVDADVFGMWENNDFKKDPKISNHNYGINPAFKAFTDESFLVKELGELNYSLMKVLQSRDLDLYSSGPLLWKVKQQCGYSEPYKSKKKEFAYCQNGRMHYKNAPIGQDCPRCSISKLNGVGTIIEVDEPEAGENFNVPFGWEFPNVENLEFNRKTANELLEGIRDRLIGHKGTGDKNGQAYNEKHVAAMIEERRAVLTTLVRQFDRIEEELIKRIAATLTNANVEVTVNSGNEFFAFSQDERWIMYTEAKNGNASVNMLTSLYDDWAAVKNKNNTSGYLRDRLIADLQPFFHFTDEYVDQKNAGGFIDDIDVLLRVHFIELLCEYELENDLIQNDEIEYKTRIENIRKWMIDNINNKLKNDERNFIKDKPAKE